jgi:GNAT superfamily N-acetyltransferase
MLEIRPAVPADVTTIHTLVADLAEYEKLAHEAIATPADLGTALFGPSPRAFCDIAEWRQDGGTSAAGMALWIYNFSTFRGRHGIYLEDLFVRPQFRGRGIGKALLVNLAQRCVREELARLEWAVLDWNTPAIDFYRSLGARSMHEWTINRLTDEPLARLAATPRVTR